VAATTIVFDIGGTWFRSGLITGDAELRGASRRPTDTFRSHPNLSCVELQDLLVDGIVRESRRLRDEAGGHARLVGISLGAAIDGHTSTVLGSGPMWGPGSRPIDLRAALRERDDSFQWTVANDVTAALMRYVAADDGASGRTVLVTISSGIACRAYDHRTRSVVLDPALGVQGEIGHLALEFNWLGRRIRARCDCGGHDHLNALSSGPGIQGLLQRAPRLVGDELRSSALLRAVEEDPREATVPRMATALAAADPLAVSLLHATTKPLADLLRTYLTFDPEIERIILTGGVVQALDPHYLVSLIGHLERDGLYQVTTRDPLFFRNRIGLGSRDDDSGLLGAAHLARLDAPPTSRRRSPGAWQLEAKLPISYRVVECRDVLDPANAGLLRTASSSRRATRVVVVDARIDRLYGERIRHYFAANEVEYRVVPVPTSETTKCIDAVTSIVEQFDAVGVSRRSEPPIGIGGGVLLDMLGLAASLYRRGTPYVRVPTTLIGLVDAGVGVKTGVNFNGHKNRLGSYHPPIASLLDVGFLKTLPERHIRNGLFEIAKVAIVTDRRLFDLLEAHAPELIAGRLQHGWAARSVLRRAISAMVNELEPNLWETQLERLVDFGHSFSSPFELHTPDLLHGEAVAIDMALSSVLAERRRLLPPGECERILSLLGALGLPLVDAKHDLTLVEEGLADTVRHRDGLPRLPLPVGIGSARFVNDVTVSELEPALVELEARAKEVTCRPVGSIAR
jgi:3-dehydroquinate synthetase/predicted NBD/HSP70 family sugar kinase